MLSVTINQGMIRRDVLTRKMESTLEPHEHLLVKEGDIAYNMMRMWQGASGLAKEDGIVSPAYVVCAPKEEIFSEYFLHLFRSPLLLKHFQDYAYGITGDRLRLYFKDFEKIHIDVPPLEERKKIAGLLDSWDRGIELTEKLLAEKMERRKGLMQGLLSGKRRLPGFEGKWKVQPLGNFLIESRIPGSNGEKAKKLSIQLHGRGVRQKNEIRQGSSSTSYYFRKSGQFIYSKLDFLNGAFGIVPEELDGFESTLDLPAFDVSAKLNKQWLLYYVTRKEYYSQQLGLANGGRKARRVNPKAFLGSKIAFPEKIEQDEIVRVLEVSGREISLLNDKLTALREQKKGLMQQLLTGKIRVKT